MAAYAGSYFVSGGGMLLVHPDGTAAGNYGQVGSDYFGDSTAFTGVFSVTPSAAVASSATFFHKSGPIGYGDPNPFPDQIVEEKGTADVRLVKTTVGGAEALRVEMSNSTVPNPMLPVTYGKVEPPVAFRNLPFSKLGGHYSDWETIPPRGQNADLNASTGALSGTYYTGCEVSATVFAYEPETTMFRMNATFQGAGCAAAGTAVGSGSFVGHLGNTRFGRLVLHAVGIAAGKFVHFSLEHSQALPY